MSPNETPPPKICPHCGASQGYVRDVCLECGKQLRFDGKQTPVNWILWGCAVIPMLSCGGCLVSLFAIPTAHVEWAVCVIVAVVGYVLLAAKVRERNRLNSIPKVNKQDNDNSTPTN